MLKGSATKTWFRKVIAARFRYSRRLTRMNGCVLYLKSHPGQPVRSGMAKTSEKTQSTVEVMINVPQTFML